MSLFPLPLTPFELMMWFDHRPEYPMVFPMICEFTGEVDRERAQQALDLVCARHPLLSASIEMIRRQPYWVASTYGSNRIDWEAPATVRQRRVDLMHEPGVRVEFHVAPGRAVMTWHFHHCCCDGASAIAVVAEWLLIYHALVSGTDWRPTVQPLDPLALIQRGDLRRRKRARAPSPTRHTTWKRWSKLWSESRTAWRVFLARPEPLAGQSLGETERCAEVFVHHLDANTMDRVRATATARQAHLNDLLLTSLLLTMQRWKDRIGSSSESSSYRIVMPTNQRVPRDRMLPAANVMSYAMLDRIVGPSDQAEELLASIQNETRAIARYNLSQQFAATLAWGAKLPAVMRFCLRRGARWSSAVLSNLGQLDRRTHGQFTFAADRVIAGDLRLEAAYGVPPIRPGTRVSVGASLYRDRLALAVLLDPHHFAPEDADRFLGLFVEQLANLSGGDRG